MPIMVILGIKNFGPQNELNDLENINRQNNVIFKGLKHDGKSKDLELAKNICIKALLGTRGCIWDNRVHPQGSGRQNGRVIAHILYG